MKKKKKISDNSRVITKNAIAAMLVLSIAVLNFAALLFALVDSKIEYLNGEVERHFANGFTLVFGKCPAAMETYSTLLKFVCICHFAVAILVVVMLAARLAIRKKMHFGKLGVTSIVLSSIFTTLYFILGCIAYSDAVDYADKGYGAKTFAFIPFSLMIILVAAYILVRIKLPENYRIVIKKKKVKNKK